MAVTGEASNITRNTNAGMDVDPDALNTLTIFLCVITNTIVLFVVRRQKDLQEVMQVLYQILAVTNTVLGISWSFWNMIYAYAGGDETICAIISMTFPFIYRSSLLIKTCCLCGISVNLYVLVTSPLRYYTIVTRTRFYTVLGACAITIMLVYGVYLPIPASPFINYLTLRCISQNVVVSSKWISIVHTTLALLPVGATMLVTTAIHARILFIVRQLKNVGAVPGYLRRVYVNHIDIDRPPNRFDDRGHEEPPANDVIRDHGVVRNRPRKKGLRGLVTVILQTGSFYILWTPYFVYFVIHVPLKQMLLIDMVVGLHSWVQPIIYLLTNPEARGLCLKAIRQCRQKLI